MFGEDLAFAYVLGTALLQTGDEQRGQQYIDRIFRAGDSAEGHLLMGTAHLNRFDYPAAKKELERAVQLNPRLPTVNSAYGRAMLGLGDQPEAEKGLPSRAGREHQRLRVESDAGEHAQERAGLRERGDVSGRAVAIHPGDLTARKLLATLKLQTGAVEEAVQMLEQVIADAPDSIDAHVQLATAYNRLKRKGRCQPGA
jgi:Tfp pilus assembly protein PilF